MPSKEVMGVAKLEIASCYGDRHGYHIDFLRLDARPKTEHPDLQRNLLHLPMAQVEFNLEGMKRVGDGWWASKWITLAATRLGLCLSFP